MSNWLGDPGHGKVDPGACALGRRECDDVLRVAKKFKVIMEFNGESVDLTRTDDSTVTLQQRVNIEHAKKYDFFVSFHRNAGGGIGIETYCYKFGCTKAYKLAVAIQKALVDSGLANVNRGVKEGNYMVLRETNTNAVLVEMGFIDNAKDNTLFEARINDYAKEIARACLAQVGKPLRMPEPPKPAQPQPTAKYGVVTADVLNVRDGRSTSTNIIGKLKSGEKVRIDQKMGDWYSIYYGSHGGFVSAQYLKEV